MMRGCKCAMSMKAARKSFPSRSSSAVLCFAVRAGQLSKRRKTTTTTDATTSAIKAKAIGHENRASPADFFFIRLRVTAKKYRPPRPMGVKGGCSPQNNRGKLRRTVLFISAHDQDDGALGVIINRPLEKQVGDLVTKAPPEGFADVPVFLGGPVGKNQLIIAAFKWEKGEGLKLNHNIDLPQT